MRTVNKLSLIAATFAVVGTSAAFADDTQLQNRLTMERQAAERNQSTSVAVFAHERGIGQNAMQSDRNEMRFELRSNPHGSVYGAYVPVR